MTIPASYLKNKPATAEQAVRWRDRVKTELIHAQDRLAKNAVEFPSHNLWRRKQNTWINVLSQRHKELKAIAHEMTLGKPVRRVATPLTAPQRDKLLSAHAHESTNPYLLMGAAKQLVTSILDRIDEQYGNDRHSGAHPLLTYEDVQLLITIRTVLKTPAAQESIEAYFQATQPREETG